MNRRAFWRQAALGATALSMPTTDLFAQEPSANSGDEAVALRKRIVEALADSNATISGVDFFGVHVDAERRFSYTVQEHRQHAFIQLRAGAHVGWAEANLGYNNEHPNVSVEKRVWRMHWFAELLGMTLAEALEHLETSREKHDYRQLEYAEMALLDLAGRALDRSCLELLELSGRNPIPGVYCILSDQVDVVAKKAANAQEQNLRSHLKVKLYGDRETDLAVVRAARKVIGSDAYLIGDVNFGYRRTQTDESIDKIAGSLIRLREAGLDGCEDPAAMSQSQWVRLQHLVGTLDLVPDAPLRPAWKAADQISAEMGRVFNMHPACMGSLIELATLGRRIQSWGKRLMVGDSSLVGPACSTWQQLAIGLQADWVEAIEKPQENDVLQQCLLDQCTIRTDSGRFALKEASPGFGMQIDEGRLRQLAYDTYSIST